MNHLLAALDLLAGEHPAAHSLIDPVGTPSRAHHAWLLAAEHAGHEPTTDAEIEALCDDASTFAWNTHHVTNKDWN